MGGRGCTTGSRAGARTADPGPGARLRTCARCCRQTASRGRKVGLAGTGGCTDPRRRDLDRRCRFLRRGCAGMVDTQRRVGPERRLMSELGDPAIRVTAMPKDANAYGDIFGGWLMSLMDMRS